MTNFYEELHLDKSKSVEEINAELSSLENTWKRREINSPEKATKILAMIIDAREVFKSAASKAQYDRELDAPIAPATNMDAEREANYLQWREQASSYYFESHQNDLARDALHQASRYKDPHKLDAEFSFLSSLVAHELGDIRTAMSSINEAILANPRKAVYHHKKGEIFGLLFDESYNGGNINSSTLDYLEKAKSEYAQALDLYKSEGDTEGQIVCLELLAALYSEIYNTDLNRAEEYARKAIALGSDSPDLQEILKSIQEDKEVFQPYQGVNHPSTSSGKGCYIATAVYGSYDCPEVWILRRYRDNRLAGNLFGRAFIKCYYAISPWLVRWFGCCGWFKYFWKIHLDELVNRLKRSGYCDERYVD